MMIRRLLIVGAALAAIAGLAAGTTGSLVVADNGVINSHNIVVADNGVVNSKNVVLADDGIISSRNIVLADDGVINSKNGPATVV